MLSIALLITAAPVYAQDADLKSSQAPPAPTASDKDGVDAGDVAQFLLGGALGLGLHESGHVIAGAAFGANPGIKGIRYGFIPFFAITHDPVSPAREYTISSAGFWVQSLTSEWLLTRRPNLARRARPDREGRPRIRRAGVGRLRRRGNGPHRAARKRHPGDGHISARE